MAKLLQNKSFYNEMFVGFIELSSWNTLINNPENALCI